MAYAIRSLEPFGFGNPVPLFGIFAVRLERITELSGGKHLKLMFKKGETSFQALLFSVPADKFCFKIGDMCDIAVCLDINVFRGESMLSVQIKAIRLSAEYGDGLFGEVAAFDDFVSGYNMNARALLPSREQIAFVYREISASPVLEKRLEYICLGSIGYAKTQIALRILCELGLIVRHDGYYSVNASAAKTDLNNSATYSRLTGGDRVDG